MLRLVTLTSKLADFIEAGFSDAAVSKMLFKFPHLFDYAIERVEVQMSALQEMGLSRPHVTTVLSRYPQLFGLSIKNIQAKAQFLTQDMAMGIQKVLTNPSYLTYSLADRIRPRWAFLNLHCKDKPASLFSQLSNSNEQFPVEMCRCPSLDEDCKLLGLTRVELFLQFLTSCKLRDTQESGRLKVD